MIKPRKYLFKWDSLTQALLFGNESIMMWAQTDDFIRNRLGPKESITVTNYPTRGIKLTRDAAFGDWINPGHWWDTRGGSSIKLCDDKLKKFFPASTKVLWVKFS
jgi:hypothetical protein